MRIIGGKFGKRRVEVPKGLDCRPTTDKAKESLFNILQNSFSFEGIDALDLFGGTGSISYELVSRGCANVICVEMNNKQLRFIHQVRNYFGMDELHVRKSDVLRYLERINHSFDFIFADPPYKFHAYEKIPQIIFEKKMLREGGILIVEHDERHDFSKHPRFVEHRNYSKVNFSFFK